MPKIVHFEIPGMEYWFTNAGPEQEEGINGAIIKRNDASQPLTIQVGVSDIDATIAAIGNAGGTVVVPKGSIPGMGHFAYFTDPDGVIIGLWQHDKNAQ